MVKISVIIPIFNVESYLSKCLKSVINQSLEDIEIICINDGSSDNSFKILKDFSKKDSRIKIINQSNHGLAYSRNIGIKNSTGDYILFLDSDDYIDVNTLEKLYNLAIKNECDLILFKLLNFDDKSGDKFADEYFDMKFLKNMIADNIFNWRDVKNRLFDISVTAPGKLYKRELIKDIEFPENLIFEDNLFFTKTIFNSDKIFFYDEYLYYRRIRSNSITNSDFDKFSDVIEIYNLVIDYVKSLGYYDIFKLTLFYKKTKNIYDKFTKVRDNDKENFFKLIIEDFTSYKNEISKDSDFKNANKRTLFILNSAVNSKNYIEFESKMNKYDSKQQDNLIKKFLKKFH